MKTVKFRFWDKERKIMITSPQGCYTAIRNVMNIYASAGFSDCNCKPDNKYITMQYIGMDDKNVANIFEGDIVLYQPENHNTTIRFEIVYDENNACFGLFPCEKGCFDSDWSYDAPMPLFGLFQGDFEVIGNRYEHKHLLT